VCLSTGQAYAEQHLRQICIFTCFISFVGGLILCHTIHSSKLNLIVVNIKESIRPRYIFIVLCFLIPLCTAFCSFLDEVRERFYLSPCYIFVFYLMFLSFLKYNFHLHLSKLIMSCLLSSLLLLHFLFPTCPQFVL
jgi:hypothetical protein